MSVQHYYHACNITAHAYAFVGHTAAYAMQTDER